MPAPLGMYATTVSFSTGQQCRFARGYAPRHIGPLTSNSGRTVRGYSGADWHWRIAFDDERMLRFLSANLKPEKTPLADALLMHGFPGKELTRPAATGLPAYFSYAGLAGPLIRLNGATGGFHCCIACIPASQAGVVILARTSSDAADRAGIAMLLAVLTLSLTLFFPKHQTVFSVQGGILYSNAYCLMPEMLYQLSD